MPASALVLFSGGQDSAVCLAWALRNGERYGVWGGLTEQQRRRIARYVDVA